jgi:hypothetical protein
MLLPKVCYAQQQPTDLVYVCVLISADLAGCRLVVGFFASFCLILCIASIFMTHFSEKF